MLTNTPFIIDIGVTVPYYIWGIYLHQLLLKLGSGSCSDLNNYENVVLDDIPACSPGEAMRTEELPRHEAPGACSSLLVGSVWTTKDQRLRGLWNNCSFSLSHSVTEGWAAGGCCCPTGLAHQALKKPHASQGFLGVWGISYM